MTSTRASFSRSSSSSSTVGGAVGGVLAAFPAFRYVSLVIGLSIMGILVRLQIQDSTLPSDLLIGESRSLAASEQEETSAPKENRMVRAVKKLSQHPKFDPSWDIFQRIEAAQTGRVRVPRTEAPPPEVDFIDQRQLSKEDAYSASWIQRTEDFLAMDIEGINTTQDASYFSFKDERRWPNVRMTMDWLDFSVEHMGSWCEMTEILLRDVPLWTLTKKMDKYISRAPGYPVRENPAFQDTLAVIAFQPIKAEKESKFQIKKAHDVNVLLLAATIESLRRAGFGRTVVAGLGDKNEKELTEEAFQMLYPHVRDRSLAATDGVPNKMGHMEVAYVMGNKEHAKTPALDQNVPKGALQGLRDAFKLWTNKKDWFGDHPSDDWRYIYYTEADSLLNTKPASLPVLKNLVEEGMVLIPHRLQPIPHQTDVGQTQEKYLFLSRRIKEFYNVIDLDALNRYPAICCDEYKGPNSKPYLTNHTDCGKPWYSCDFNPTSKPSDKHYRLKGYNLIRLTQGSDIVLLASQDSGRMCVPPPKRLVNSQTCKIPKPKKK